MVVCIRKPKANAIPRDKDNLRRFFRWATRSLTRLSLAVIAHAITAYEASRTPVVATQHIEVVSSITTLAAAQHR